MWPSIIAALTSAMKDRADRKERMRKAQDEALAAGPSWRYRRRLIHGAYVMGVVMIIAGGATVFLQSQIGVELIIGGVALISIIVTAYTTSATYEDVRLWNKDTRIRFGETPEEEMHGDNLTD